MSTFLELQTQIADELDDDDLLTDGQIAKAILAAIKEYRDRRFWFNQVIEKFFSLTSGTEYIIPSLLSVSGISTTEPITTIDLLKIDDGTGGNYWPITLVDNSKIDAAQTGSIVGRPQFAALVSDASGTKIRFYPIPDRNYTPVVQALVRFQDISADGDTNPWLTDGEELIHLAAMRKVMSNVTKELPFGSPPLPAEQKALSDLYKTTRMRMGSPQVRTEVADMQGNRCRVDIRYG